MRSRDGDHSFTRAISSIIFLLLYSSALFADEYIISYRYSVKNATLYNETLYVSKAMKKCEGKPYYNTLILDPKKSENLKEILLANQEEFIAFLYKIGLSVMHHEETHNGVNDSSTILTLPSKCFKVDFNDNSVKIAPLK